MKIMFHTVGRFQSWKLKKPVVILTTVLLLMQLLPASYSTDSIVPQAQARDQYSQKITTFPTNTFPNTDNGGVIGVGDLDRDGHIDFIRAKVGWKNNGDNEITAYDWQGNQLWSVVKPSHLSEFKGGFIFGVVGDSDNDGDAEFHFVGDNAGKDVVILDGSTGVEEHRITIGGQGWSHVALARISSPAAQDIVVSHKGAVAVFSGTDHAPIWNKSDSATPQGYGPTRVADIDNDGYDEVLWNTYCLDNENGVELWKADAGKLQNYSIGDVDLNNPGLEVVYAKYNETPTDEYTPYKQLEVRGLNGYHWLIQLEYNVHLTQIGDFRTNFPGLEIFNRTRAREPGINVDSSEHTLLSAHGITSQMLDADFLIKDDYRDQVVITEDFYPQTHPGYQDAQYPKGIDWDGDDQLEILCVERHTSSPNVKIVDSVTGAVVYDPGDSVQGMDEGAAFAMDIAGDSREEIVIWNADSITIIHNPAHSLNPGKPSYWDSWLYRTNKVQGNHTYNPGSGYEYSEPTPASPPSGLRVGM